MADIEIKKEEITKTIYTATCPTCDKEHQNESEDFAEYSARNCCPDYEERVKAIMDSFYEIDDPDELSLKVIEALVDSEDTWKGKYEILGDLELLLNEREKSNSRILNQTRRLGKSV